MRILLWFLILLLRYTNDVVADNLCDLCIKRFRRNMQSIQPNIAVLFKTLTSLGLRN